ncbi:MAG: hypothetical protein IJ087_23070 [Eggerthellaceae bacterium]|nr:hypothetical protein [Eggerthellaceae bacterium]
MNRLIAGEYANSVSHAINEIRKNLTLVSSFFDQRNDPLSAPTYTWELADYHNLFDSTCGRLKADADNMPEAQRSTLASQIRSLVYHLEQLDEAMEDATSDQMIIVSDRILRSMPVPIPHPDFEFSSNGLTLCEAVLTCCLTVAYSTNLRARGYGNATPEKATSEEAVAKAFGEAIALCKDLRLAYDEIGSDCALPSFLDPSASMDSAIRDSHKLRTATMKVLSSLEKVQISRAASKASNDPEIRHTLSDALCKSGETMSSLSNPGARTLLLALQWSLSTNGPLPLSGIQAANVYGSDLLTLGEINEAAIVLAELLHGPRWEPVRKALLSATRTSNDQVDEPNHSLHLAHARANFAYILGQYARFAHQEALAFDRFGDPSSAWYRQLSDLAMALNALALTEITQSPDTGSPASELTRVALLHDRYRFGMPSRSEDGLDSLRQAFVAIKSCFNVTGSYFLRDEFPNSPTWLFRIGLDYLGEQAGAPPKPGEEGYEDHEERFLEDLRFLCSEWRTANVLVGLTDQYVLRACTTALEDKGLDEHSVYVLTSSLTSIRLQALKAKACLRFDVSSSFIDGTTTETLSTLSTILGHEDLANMGSASVARVVVRDLLASPAEPTRGKVTGYYTHLQNACRLFEDLCMPPGAAQPEALARLDKVDSGHHITEDAVNCLTCMHASYMNDPSEGSALYQYIALGRSRTFLGDTAAELRDRMFDGSFVFIKSFTECIDELHMWSRYGCDSDGQSGAGCFVSFHPATFASPYAYASTAVGNVRPFATLGVSVDDDAFQLYQVAYLSKDPETGSPIIKGCFHPEYGKIVSKGLRIIANAMSSIAEVENRLRDVCETAAFRSLASIAFLFKDASYADEKELRLVIMRDLNNAGSSDICVIPSKKDENPVSRYCVKPFRQVYIDKIVLGPKFEDSHEVIPHLQYELAKIKRKAAKRDIHLDPTVVRSKIPYR